MIIALTQTLTHVKCVSQVSWLCLYNKRENVILTLIPPLMHVKGGIKYVMDLPLHLSPVKGEVKHVSYFDYSFDARQRRSKTPWLCIPLIFDLLCQRCSKAPWLCTTLILRHVRSKASQRWTYPATPI